MMKKNEVLTILENGGYILLNEIYRSANVYSLNDERLDTCRYDTAQRIAAMDGYQDESAGAWTYTRRIQKAEVAAEMLAAQAVPAADPEPAPAQEPKHYTSEGEDTTSAAQAMAWHRAGRAVTVWGHRQDGTAYHVRITGQAQKPARDGNRDHCRRIAKELEQYAAGNVYKCPDCGEYITLRDDFDGDKYKCPDCGTVHEIEYLEQQTMWDYLEDCLDIEYRISSDRETVRSVQICVAWGGPSIYLDTETKNVELYWWGDRASYPMSYDVCDALDEWAQELWEIG